MILKVIIADEINEFEFDDNEVLIGSNPSNHIFLNYEGISAIHLKIFETTEGLKLINQSKEFSTYIGDSLLKFGEEILFNNLSVEVGGIFISSISPAKVSTSNTADETKNFTIQFDQLNEEPQVEIDDLLPPDLSKEDFISDEEKVAIQIKNEFEKDKNIDREKYKPDILIPSGISSATKKTSKKNTKKETNSTKISSLEDNFTKRRSNTRKKTRTRKKNKHIPSSRFSLSTIIITSCTFCVVAIIYYFQFYKKETQVTLKNEIAGFQLLSSPIYMVNQKINIFQEVINKGLCEEEAVRQLCQTFNDQVVPKNYEGFTLFNDEIYLFISNETLEILNLNLEKTIPNDHTYILEYVNKFYQNEINLDQLKENKYIADLKEESVFREKHSRLLELTSILFSEKYKQKLLDLKWSRLNLININVDQTKLRVDNFIMVQKDKMKYLHKVESQKAKEFLLFQYSKFSRNIESFFSSFSTSHLYEFKNDEFETFVNDTKAENNRDVLTKIKCSSELEKKYCNEFEKIVTIEENKGAYFFDNKLYLVYELNELIPIFTKIHMVWLEPADRKEILIAYRRFTPETDFTKFTKEDYINNDISYFDYQLSILLTPFLDQNYINMILESNQSNDPISKVKEVVLLGYNKDPSGEIKLRVILGLDALKLTADDFIESKKLIHYFWRSKIFSFKDFIESKKTFYNEVE